MIRDQGSKICENNQWHYLLAVVYIAWLIDCRSFWTLLAVFDARKCHNCTGLHKQGKK